MKNAVGDQRDIYNAQQTSVKGVVNTTYGSKPTLRHKQPLRREQHNLHAKGGQLDDGRCVKRHQDYHRRRRV